MSTHRDASPTMRRRITLARLAALGVVASALAGIIAIAPTSHDSADATTSGSSAVTIKWTGDTSAAAAFQPTRSTASPHYGDFSNLSITVSQTVNIIDQAVRVSVAGFSPTISSFQSALPLDNAKNYLQAMQCWGPDPLAADFNETCEWGGRYKVERNGLGQSIYPDNAARTGPLDFDLAHPTTHDVPFRTVDGTVVSGKSSLVAGEEKYPILDYFSASTTNEVNTARVGSDGTGYFDFETQSSYQAPQLGCGTAGHLRCWLVVVPRGSHFGGDGEECSGIRDPANFDELYTYGRPNSIQGGSPVNDLCDYWDNRIVVPLDFTPTGSTCAVGSPEVRVIGSQLMLGAMSSWQPSLCQTVHSTFSFSTNPDSVARAQLIDTGANSPSFAYTGFPVSPGELLTDEERTRLAATKLTYAPVAVSSVVVAFLAEGSGGRQESLVVSPRLMAKLLTQSYPFLVPASSGNTDKNAAQLGAVNRTYNYLYKDPEFQALNPSNYAQFSTAPTLVLPGPSGADAIRQVWRWIFADSDAVAFLNGAADPSGMTVNPYYLPKGNAAAVVPWYFDENKNYIATPVQRQVGMTNLDGSPQKLTEQVLDTFPKNDESLMPLQLTGERSRFDSIQFSPYAETLLAGARQAFRADPNSKTTWNPNAINLAGEAGDWVSSGAQAPGQKFMMVVTDSVSAARYGLSVASIRGANSATAVAPTAPGMTSALSALAATSLDSVKQVNPAAVPTDGYPLTVVTYAAVNLSKSTAAARATISDMLKQVTTTGQVSGSAIGELPAGYLPLTTALATTAASVATDVKNYVAPTSDYAQDDYESGYDGGSDGGLGGDGTTDPTTTPDVDSGSADRTLASSTQPVARYGLAVSLVVGLAGFIGAPILVRGRRLL